MSAAAKFGAEYTAAEVAAHNSPSDCWVVVHGAVVDVTSFLHSHPGGISALSKDGRAGMDVSSHFDRIGHSETAKALLQSMRIGTLAEGAEGAEGERAALLPSGGARKGDAQVHADREHAVQWHAARRQAILRDHPEVAELMGSNPWTCLIGLLTVLVHGYVCLWVQRPECPWYMVWVAAYTVGAVCKMYQFAVNHDICHGTAGSWLERVGFLKHSAMQLMTLPTMGGAMHTYYEFQHIGHHASLGSHSFADVVGLGEEDRALFGPRGSIKPGEGAKLNFNPATINNVIFFPDSDGDLFAIGNLSYGKLLERWSRSTDAETGETQNERHYISPKAGDNDFVETGADLVQEFHKYKILKCLAIQFLHVSHQGVMALVLYVQTLLLLPIVTVPLFVFPRSVARLINKTTRHFNNGKPIIDELSEEGEFHLVYTMIRIMASVGLHAWIAVGVAWWLLFGHRAGAWTAGSVLKGFFYLYLSELFLYGFAMHPFMGYFLGVHRSGGGGFESKKQVQSGDRASRGCQPTMSTYSIFAAAASMNLTHHVEHHDFPGIPWSRLPTVTRLAPEYYDHLEQSPGFCATIYRWIHYSGSWGYACH